MQQHGTILQSKRGSILKKLVHQIYLFLSIWRLLSLKSSYSLLSATFLLVNSDCGRTLPDCVALLVGQNKQFEDFTLVSG